MKADNTITGTSDFVYQLVLSRTYYKVWILSVIGGTMNRVIFLLAAADTFLCRPMRLKIWDQNPKS